MTHGQTAVSEVLSRSSSTTGVIGGGEPSITSVNLRLFPQDCAYDMTVQWSLNAVHSPSGQTHTGIGGFVKLTGSMPAGGKEPVLAGSKPVHTYYLPARMPETPAEYFTLFGTLIYTFPQMTGSEQFADANVTWSLAPDTGEQPEEEPTQPPIGVS